MAEQGETATQVRDRLFLACRGLRTLARAYTVGDTALLVVSADDGTWPRTLAWLEYEGVKVCFVATGAEELALFAPLFGGEFPALEYFAMHESLEQAWYCLSTGGDGTRASGQHHRNRALGAYAKACLRNLRRRISPAPAPLTRAARGAPRRAFVQRVTRETLTQEGYERVVVEQCVEEQPHTHRRNYSERSGAVRRNRGKRGRGRGRGARRNRK